MLLRRSNSIINSFILMGVISHRMTTTHPMECIVH
nr:MAG TPA: hypothetical protein [Inoviridae sp.]